MAKDERKSTGPSQPQRKRQRTRRPPPPPPPPASLVQLLQTDSSVVTYFQSLQTNLDADVQTWKDRAHQLQLDNDRLRQRLQDENDDDPKKKPRGSKKQSTSPRKTQPISETTKVTKPTPRQASRPQASSKHVDKAFHFGSNSDEHPEDEQSVESLDTTTKAPPEPSALGHAPNVGVPIDDSMFDSMDDEDDDASDLFVNTTKPVAVQQERRRHDDTEYHQDVFAFLREAYQIMARLGISLVEHTTVADSGDAQKTIVTDQDHFTDSTIPTLAVNPLPDDNDLAITADEELRDESESRAPPDINQAQETNTFVGQAQSDEQVVHDILQWLRSPNLPDERPTNENVTPEGTNTEKSELICPTTLVLYCNPLHHTESTKQHPLLHAKRLLIRALVLMDTFCSPTLSKAEWDVYFEFAGVANGHEIKVGLRGRKRVVDQLLHYLDTEVSERWACHDRTKRQNTPAVHFIQDGELAVSTSLLGGGSTMPYVKTLMDRSMACQILSTFHLLRGDGEKAADGILQYLVATTPCLNLEDHPKLPPTMSVLAIESLLLQSDVTLLEYSASGVEKWFDARCLSMWNGHVDRDIFLRALALAIHVSASIWSERLPATDPVVHDVACIELASYCRLLTNNPWMCTEVSASDSIDSVVSQLGGVDWLEAACSVANQVLEAGSVKENTQEHARRIDAWHIALQISTIVRGDVSVIEEVATELMSDDATAKGTLCEATRGLSIWKSCVSSIIVRRALVLRSMDVAGSSDDGLVDSHFTAYFETIISRSLALNSSEQLLLLCAGLDCATIASSGNCTLRAVQLIITLQNSLESSNDTHETVVRPFLDLLTRSSQRPVVRVINLERRKDRLSDFMRRAFRERIVVVKAVTSLREAVRTGDKVGDGYEFGLHAIDGQGRLVEAASALVQQVGPTLNKFVESHWRPNDVRPFDINAPDVETMVRTSPSEQACALSHLSSWIGVKRSLHMATQGSMIWDADGSRLFRSPDSTTRLFKISGFAKGPAMLAKNDTMPPSPVCVILEDDAIIVDRFAERLSEILEELPRDFHFCSLGYSRPKSAPIAPYGNHLGVPSMLWYLTGYCLSEAGANYLLDSLPVVGPVDSWIGLKMTRNWDNAFGVKLGVGVHSRPQSELPSHADLARILDFRAFCARVPLCTQRVWETGNGRNRINWRQRDTDIEYSGYAAKVTKRTNK